MLTFGPEVVKWVEEQLDTKFGPTAQGIGDGRAAVVFDEYRSGVDIQMHIAKREGEILSPTLVAAMMHYPFEQLKVKRITGYIAENNLESQRFAKKLGARLEGVLKDALPEGNLCIYGLLREDAGKWLSKPFKCRLGVVHGQSS